MFKRLGEWIIDDWEAACRRTLAKRFSRNELAIFRRQWRLGQAAKAVLLLLLFLVLASFLAPDATVLLRGALILWAVGEGVLLIAHVALGVRGPFSYGWAFHHRHPMLLSGLSARRDLRNKAFLAACAVTIALLALVAN